MPQICDASGAEIDEVGDFFEGDELDGITPESVTASTPALSTEQQV
jgi:hypothetical protein